MPGNPKLGARVETPYILTQSAVPIGSAPNGTIAVNGTVTLGTALPTTYSSGIWLRFPASAVSGGSAGLYWVVMSSTTVGQVYTAFVDTASPFTPYIPQTLVAAVGSNVAYTQATGTDIVVANITVPGGAIGANGSMRGTYLAQNNNSAGNKLYKSFLSTTQLSLDTRTTTVGVTGSFMVRNRGVQNRNLLIASGTGGPSIYAFGTNAGAVANSTGTVDTSVSQQLTLVLNVATATDYAIFDGFAVEILPSQ